MKNMQPCLYPIVSSFDSKSQLSVVQAFSASGFKDCGFGVNTVVRTLLLYLSFGVVL